MYTINTSFIENKNYYISSQKNYYDRSTSNFSIWVEFVE